MLLLEVGIWSTSSLGRLRLELLALEAITFSSLCRELFRLPAQKLLQQPWSTTLWKGSNASRKWSMSWKTVSRRLELTLWFRC